MPDELMERLEAAHRRRRVGRGAGVDARHVRSTTSRSSGWSQRNRHSSSRCSQGFEEMPRPPADARAAREGGARHRRRHPSGDPHGRGARRPSPGSTTGPRPCWPRRRPRSCRQSSATPSTTSSACLAGELARVDVGRRSVRRPWPTAPRRAPRGWRSGAVGPRRCRATSGRRLGGAAGGSVRGRWRRAGRDVAAGSAARARAISAEVRRISQVGSRVSARWLRGIGDHLDDGPQGGLGAERQLVGRCLLRRSRPHVSRRAVHRLLRPREHGRRR